ncbi:AraC family transcriptional regulator [Deinobacterium chartae]|uniref:AraC family transcriptional regulator n=1 Tax=Deinobacterium chartae TaxID=521158 RepID=A0A841HYH3_9DEIO|nr:helix-turn-helix domain-containing protein [Deinobacterium chartae]MBB6097269.1 AraC family transcriptional regulator [Deinobacterium chartae]
MDHFDRIQRAIDYLETQLQGRPDIRDVAAQAGFSPFHFQRLFQAITGTSVQAYLRRRRLSEAAKALRSSARSVLDLALDYQYASQEAFTRAFEQQFGIAPARYRKAGEPGPLVGPLRLSDYRCPKEKVLKMLAPTLLKITDVQIIGCAFRTTLENHRHYQDIPGFYARFGSEQTFLRIPERVRPDFAYGVACDFEDDGTFSFVIGEESAWAGEDLAPLVSLRIPGGLYAAFQADGSVPNLRDYIYGTWLPNSLYERREGPDFEVTDVAASLLAGIPKMTVYIPVSRPVVRDRSRTEAGSVG